MSDKWILVDGEPQPADLMTWARWFESSGAARIVAKTDLPDGVRVSTVFLGLNHDVRGDGPPVLWETMIFGGKHGGHQDVYTSRAAAEAGHLNAVAIAKGEREP